MSPVNSLPADKNKSLIFHVHANLYYPILRIYNKISGLNDTETLTQQIKYFPFLKKKMQCISSST